MRVLENLLVGHLLKKSQNQCGVYKCRPRCSNSRTTCIQSAPLYCISVRYISNLSSHLYPSSPFRSSAWFLTHLSRTYIIHGLSISSSYHPAMWWSFNSKRSSLRSYFQLPVKSTPWSLSSFLIILAARHMFVPQDWKRNFIPVTEQVK
jgi:hypothetical protein